MIFTGLTALYKKGIIDFKGDILNVSLKHGHETSKGIAEKLGYEDIRVDWETNTYGMFSEEINNETLYSNERLLLEINKFAMSSEVKSKAIKFLLINTSPYKLVKVYKVLRKKRRGIDYPQEALKIINNYKNPIERIKDGDQQELLNNYFLKVIERTDVNLIIKGGTAIQAYWESKRKTLDIDSHGLKEDIESFLDTLKNSDNEIRFIAHELHYENGVEEIGKKVTADYIQNKRVIKLAMVPVTYGNAKHFQDIKVKLTINTTIINIDEIIKSYKITKRSIGEFKAMVNVFSKEMLIAEKFQSIIVKPESSTRTKDLLDIYYLVRDNYDIQVVKKWLLKKFSKQKDKPLSNWNKILKLIKENIKCELIKIEKDWQDATTMYAAYIKYKDAFKVYEDIANKLMLIK